jgi:hypothetical protein
MILCHCFFLQLTPYSGVVRSFKDEKKTENSSFADMTWNRKSQYDSQVGSVMNLLQLR